MAIRVFRRRAGLLLAAVSLLFSVRVWAADPGLPLTNAEVNDQKTGSVLVYPLFLSNAASAASENTRITITNTSVDTNAFVRLFFVDGSSGAVNSGAFVPNPAIALTPNQTASFLASDVDPGVRGYLVAVAINTSGCPVNFNFLAGEAYVKLSSGHSANLPAEAFAALSLTPVASCGATATLNFDGASYNLLPRTLALSKLRSPVDGNTTQLIVIRLGGNLATNTPDTLGALNGELISDLGTGTTFSRTDGTPQLFTSVSSYLTSATPALALSTAVPAGRTGWLTLSGASNAGLLGALINFNPSAASAATAYRSGHNLTKLTLAAAVSLTIPVLPPF